MDEAVVASPQAQTVEVRNNIYFGAQSPIAQNLFANLLLGNRSWRLSTIIRSSCSGLRYFALGIHLWIFLIAIEMGTFMHACEGEMVCESINPKIPYFNAPIYLENKVHLSYLNEMKA